MASRNGTALTIMYVVAFIVGCIIMALTIFVGLTESMTSVSLDSSYHPVAACYHEHRI